jgi:hypothetical protein
MAAGQTDSQVGPKNETICAGNSLAKSSQIATDSCALRGHQTRWRRTCREQSSRVEEHTESGLAYMHRPQSCCKVVTNFSALSGELLRSGIHQHAMCTCTRTQRTTTLLPCICSCCNLCWLRKSCTVASTHPHQPRLGLAQTTRHLSNRDIYSAPPPCCLCCGAWPFHTRHNDMNNRPDPSPKPQHTSRNNHTMPQSITLRAACIAMCGLSTPSNKKLNSKTHSHCWPQSTNVAASTTYRAACVAVCGSSTPSSLNTWHSTACAFPHPQQTRPQCTTHRAACVAV